MINVAQLLSVILVSPSCCSYHCAAHRYVSLMSRPCHLSVNPVTGKRAYHYYSQLSSSPNRHRSDYRRPTALYLY
ncbi:hypothetical protein BC629DRAFT_1495884 [Irpex lacteus]|nr:hypothetical protein BC629DRAFT_1495884 [Irpex lacteus]